MATIDAKNVTLTVSVPGTKPAVTFNPVWDRFDFHAPTITLSASMRLTGAAAENVGNWTLGFVQLKYIGTNHARYRGAASRDGSILVTSSNKIVCRDTDDGSTEVWYDTLNSGGIKGPRGTNKLGAAIVIPGTGYLDVSARLFDRPFRMWDAVLKNSLTPGNPDNFLTYAVAELLFCSMLVAQDPAGKFHMLKHVYWNVIWEHTFKRDAAGNVIPDRAIRLEQNVQKQVQSGSPNDPKFTGKEFDTTLPISNSVTRRPPKIIESRS